MISLYEDLLETRVRIHEINECNLGNKFIEKICEQKQITPEYKFPVLENTSFVEKDLLFLENLERLLDDSNKAFLENYQTVAEAINPIGLVADKVSRTSWNPESLDYLYNQVKDALKSNNIDTVDDLIEKSAVPGMCFGRPLSDMVSCDKEHIMESVFTEAGLFNRVRELINQRNNKKTENKNNNSKKTSTKNTPYEKKVVHSKAEMDTFYKNNDYLIECVSADEELYQTLANVLNRNFDIKTPVKIYVISGKDFNKIYDLYGDNAYRNDTHHVIIPLSTLKNTKDIVAAKGLLRARYTNDVVDNNEYREYLAGRHQKSEQIQWLIDYHSTNECSIETYQLTREDITEAVEVIKQTKNKIEDIKKKAADKVKDRKQKICNMKKDMEQAAKEVCRKPCAECCLVAAYLEMEDMINHAEIVALETQMIEELSKARSNIARTAFHNPRNIRESKILTDMIGEYTTENLMNLIKEAETADGAFIPVDEAFEGIRSKMTLSNKKFLKKYESQALSSNCEGIMMKKYYIPVTGLEKKCNDLIKEVETEFKKGLNDDDPDEMKKRFKEIRGSFVLGFADGESTAKGAKMLDGKSISKVKNLAVKEETNHKVTKQDVQFAVNYLKDIDKRIDDAEREYQKIVGSITQAFYTPLRTLGRTKGEKYVKKIERITKETIENIQLNYRKIKLSQLKVMQQQSRKVVLLASRTKATESDISDMEYLNNLLESYIEDLK